VPPLRHALLALCAVSLVPGGGRLSGADNRGTAFSASAPVTDPVVSTFTKDGCRSWLLRGSQCRIVSQSQIDFTNLNLTVFVGDPSNRVESIFLSPAATAFVDQARVSGPGAVRIITDDFEATGADWTYDHRQKKVSIRKNVRVVFPTQLQSILR
jgi:lipopolysaccharide export system protein LptC